MNDSIHIVCPHCTTVNRIPAVRLADRPVCGKCRKPLFNSQPVELGAASFQRHLGRNDIPLLVDFWAPWCGPCKMMGPAFAQAAGRMEPEVRMAKVNTEIEQVLASQFSIRSIPTMVLFVNGQEKARQSGALDASAIIKWTRQHF